MPTTIAIRFPWGRYHGTPWGRNVNEGVVDWPPEPWRLLRALYATWQSRAPELPEATVTALLDALAEPPEYVVPPHRVAHTRHYYPDAKYGPKGGGTDKVFDTFAVTERDAELRVIWPTDLATDQRDALAVLCDRLTYLGRADSICIARAVTDDDHLTPPPPDHRHIHPHPANPETTPPHEARGVLAAARPLDLNALEVRPQRARRAGHIEPPGSRRVLYPPVPEATIKPQTTARRATTRATAPVTAVRYRMVARALPSPQAAVVMADALRQAVLRAFDSEGTGRESITLIGKDRHGRRTDTDHNHAHYLAFSSNGADTHRLDTLLVWAPAGLTDDELEALTAPSKLRGFAHAREFRPCLLGIEATGTVEHIAPELAGPASRWRSLTPYAPPRHIRRQPTWYDHAEAFLRRDLTKAGLPTPTRIERLTNKPWLSYRRHRLKERLSNARRATGFHIEFDEPVTGPISVRALRHFGLGLFLPTNPTPCKT